MSVVVTKELPEGWQWTTMEDIADIIGGGTPKSKESRYYDGGKIPWLTPADLSGYKNKYVTRGRRNITEEGLSSSSAKMMPAGSVLFTSRAPIGYVVIASNDICTNQGFKSFVMKSEDTLPDYVYWWLKGNKQLAESMASGTTFLELSGSKAKKLPIPIAPPEQQKCIVAKIEELFSHIDAGIEALKKAKQLLKQYRQSVLKAAVTGELTKEWREENKDKLDPANQLLDKISSEKEKLIEDKIIKKRKALKPIDDEEKYFSIPDSWAWAQCAEICKPDTIITYGILKPVWVESGVQTVRIKDMKGGKILINEVVRCCPERAEKFIKTTLEENDLLIAKDGATLGKTAFVPRELVGGNVTQHVLRFSISSYCDRRYVRIFIDSPIGQGWMSGETKGVALPGVNVIDFNRMPVPMPSLNEQKTIAELVDQKLTTASHVEKELDSQLANAEINKQSILASAFSGHLGDC